MIMFDELWANFIIIHLKDDPEKKFQQLQLPKFFLRQEDRQFQDRRE